MARSPARSSARSRDRRPDQTSRESPMARPRTPLLSREGIVAAALALVDAEGLDALSTRRLAAELGVSGPSLYNHVATKDELIDAVVDSVVAGVDVSAFGGSDWRAALAAWARS